MPILPHDTGHVMAQDGRLLRVDQQDGRWIGVRYTRDLREHDVFYGTDKQVHEMVEHWRRL